MYHVHKLMVWSDYGTSPPPGGEKHEFLHGGVKLMTDVKPIPAAPTTGSLIINQTASFATRSLPKFLRAHLYKPRYDTILANNRLKY
jgi:hypothetical protein